MSVSSALFRGGRASKVHSSVFLKPVGGIGIRDGVPTYQRALIAAALGEQDEAVRLLNDAVRRGRAVFGLFRHDPEFQALQGYPAYERFMAPKDSPTPPPASPLSPMMLVLALSGLAAVVTAMFLWRKRQPAR